MVRYLFRYLLLLTPFVGVGFTSMANKNAELDSLNNDLSNVQHDTLKAKTLLRIASIHLFSNPDTAYTITQQAQELAVKNDNQYLVGDCENKMGISLAFRSHFSPALDHFLKAEKIFSQLNDLKKQAQILGNIGNIYWKVFDLDNGLKYQKEALEIKRELNDTAHYAISYQNIGLIYIAKEEFKEALKNFQLAEKYTRANNYLRLSILYSNMGIAYEQGNNLKKADSCFDKSLEVTQLDPSQPNLGSVKYYKGNLQLELGKIGEAITWCTEALDWGDEKGIAEVQRDACKCLSRGHELQGRYKLAMDFDKRYYAYRDSIINQQKTNEVTRKRIESEFSKKLLADSLKHAKEAEIKVEQDRRKEAVRAEEDKRQQTIVYGLGIGLLLLLGLALVLYRSIQNKVKANKIISAQKEEVEQQKEEVTEQKLLVEEKNREITDSITYAKRLQEAILPPISMVQEYLPASFILYKPKDIVSGDFYWVEKVDGRIYFAAVDCTGHGVPGAMVSVVGHNGLNRCINEFRLRKPAEILDKLTELVEETFDKSESDVKDGMDISLCCFDPESKSLEYAGANNPLYIISQSGSKIQSYTTPDGQEKGGLLKSSLQLNDFHLMEVKADKQPIGKYSNRKPFTNQTIQLTTDDSIYIFTDGYADQFGGDAGKKYKYSRLKNALLEQQKKSPIEQHQYFEKEFENWKGDLEQVDDVCVIGVRI
jgi:serine phosphatase RsbU (regulator of sigma subunit)